MYLNRRVFVMRKHRLIRLRGCAKIMLFRVKWIYLHFSVIIFLQASQVVLLEFNDTVLGFTTLRSLKVSGNRITRGKTT